MGILLILLPLLITASAFYLYRHNGKREIMRLDLVQFAYAFVLLPVVFIWMKSFMYVVLKSELNLSLSFSEFFIVDTTFSTLFLFIYAFVVIHSLTKSFHLKRYRDPLYDMFDHSEYFHLTVSHAVIYGGVLLLAALTGVINLIWPLSFNYTRNVFRGIAAFGGLSGVIAFIGIWKYESPTPMFMRIMKLLFGLFFTIYVVLYYAMEIPFNSRYLLYWFVFFAYLLLVVLGVVAEKPDDKSGVFHYLPFRINPKKIGWYALFMKRRLGALTEQRS